MTRILIVALWVLLASSCASASGGGGSTQAAPDRMKPEEGALLKLELSVWGAGGPIEGRYTSIAAFYRVVGDKEYSVLSPKLISQDDKRQLYEFRIPAYAKGTAGEIEYYFEMKLDGHFSRVDGIKKIKLGDSN